MIRWIPYTFVRTVLFFIGGIFTGFQAPLLIPEKVSIALVALTTLVYFLIVFLGRRNRRVLNPGWFALPLVFLLGYVHVVRSNESRRADHLLNITEPVSHYQAVITRFAEEKTNTWKIEALMTKVRTNSWTEKRGRIILYFSKDDFPVPFRYGDVLLIKGQPGRPEGPANPGEFDYRNFLALKNIYHQHFLRRGEAVKIDHRPPYRFMELAFNSREWSEATLARFIRGTQEFGIASALVLGATDGLDHELLNAYAATGSMHILAVSGLHISVLYFILLWILSPLNKVRGGRWLVAIAALLLLWLYAFVTGLSPSVLRAVAMFSLLALAKPWARSTNVYNTLAVSAFCLLLFDPFLLWSVGFQLSYLAVAGIVFLYPKILMLWEPRQWLVVEAWKISAVCIAAQIATFPLGLLYFHQFPNYFLLSNLLVVPLSFVVLIAGLLVLITSFVPLIPALIGFCLELIIKLLNGIVFGLERLPFSLIENVHISPTQCALLMALIITCIFLTEYRKFKYVVIVFVVVLSFASLQWIHYAREVHVERIIVYKVPGHSVMDLMDRGHVICLADSLLQDDPQKIRFHVSPNRVLAGVRSVTTDPPVSHWLKGARLIFWNGKVILQITDAGFELPGPLAVNWIVIGNNALPQIRSIQEKVSFKKVILDSSNSFFFAIRFLEEARLHNLDVHSVLHQGAFISETENQDT
jgi:competence protein ComEC